MGFTQRASVYRKIRFTGRTNKLVLVAEIVNIMRVDFIVQGAVSFPDHDLKVKGVLHNAANIGYRALQED